MENTHEKLNNSMLEVKRVGIEKDLKYLFHAKKTYLEAVWLILRLSFKDTFFGWGRPIVSILGFVFGIAGLILFITLALSYKSPLLVLAFSTGLSFFLIVIISGLSNKAGVVTYALWVNTLPLVISATPIAALLFSIFAGNKYRYTKARGAKLSPYELYIPGKSIKGMDKRF
jgi:hypothetical protein